MNSIVISMINHSEIGVMFTNLAIFLGPTTPVIPWQQHAKIFKVESSSKLMVNESCVFLGVLLYIWQIWDISMEGVCLCVWCPTEN